MMTSPPKTDQPKTDHFRYPPHFYSPWDDFTANIPQWQAFLGPLAGRPGLRFLEIGTGQGRAAVWLAETILTGGDAFLYTVDPATEHENGPIESDDQQRNLAPYLADGRIRFAQTVSDVFLKAFPRVEWSESQGFVAMPASIDPPFDFVYIDGDHSPSQALFDAVNGFTLVKPGGLVCFDDYPWTDRNDPSIATRVGIDAFLTAYAGRFELLHKEWQVWIRRTK